MHRCTFRNIALIALAACACQTQARQQSTAPIAAESAMQQRELGKVDLPVSCNEDASAKFERGLLLLHHMNYNEARENFMAAAKTQPDCAMAHWGVAMTLVHPLWPDQPSADNLAKGWELIERANGAGKRSAVEQALIDGLAMYYRDGAKKSEKERLVALAQGFKKAHEQHRGQQEVALFYALAHLSNGSPADKTRTNNKEAGAIAEKILAASPQNPGAHH